MQGPGGEQEDAGSRRRTGRWMGQKERRCTEIARESMEMQGVKGDGRCRDLVENRKMQVAGGEQEDGWDRRREGALRSKENREMQGVKGDGRRRDLEENRKMQVAGGEREDRWDKRRESVQRAKENREMQGVKRDGRCRDLEEDRKIEVAEKELEMYRMSEVSKKIQK
jgi:hypothetical protein